MMKSARKRKFWIALLVLTALFLGHALLGQERSLAADVSREIRALTGAPTRLVWCKATDNPRDYYAQSSTFQLYGLDTEDRRGPRRLLPKVSGYCKPLLTPDGNRIIYTNRRENAVYLLKWGDSKPQKLTAGVASHVWQDPRSHVEWLYVRSGNGNQDQAMVRQRLDNSKIQEVVWSKTKIGIGAIPWFRTSADGKMAVDGFPWPQCGVARLPNQSWRQAAGGCWPSIAPDDSYRMFVFRGDHRGVTMFDKGQKNKRTVSINNAPNINGRDVYHPRWSSHPRYLTMTGPGVGGHDSNLYLGEFSKDFSKVGRWVQVTRDDRGDFYGDAWIGRAGSRPAK